MKRKVLGIVLIGAILCLAAGIPLAAMAQDDIPQEPVQEEYYIGPDGLKYDIMTGELYIEPTPTLHVTPPQSYTVEENTYYLDWNGSIYISADGPVDCTIVKEGPGTLYLDSDLEITGGITVLEGGFDTQDYDLTADSVYVGSYGQENLIEVNLGSSSLHLFSLALRGDNIDFNAGESTITTTLLYDDTAKRGHLYNDVVLQDKEIVTEVPAKYGMVLHEETDEETGEVYSYEVREIVEPATTVTNTVYAYVEGLSKFKHLIAKGNVYIKDDLETDDFDYTKAELKSMPKPDKTKSVKEVKIKTKELKVFVSGDVVTTAVDNG